MDNILKIAVIGDPNKGKSSFVSTLAYDDGVSVSSKSGETTLSSCHPLKIANEIVYELYDTPGFNNDEELLDYIEDNEANFEDFYSLINAFIQSYKNNSAYSKDIEICKILIKKPIIIYIADNSLEYNSNYNCQLEIIKKFNLSSFLIFNQKENIDKRSTWINSTSEYFISSFEFNVLSSNFNNKINFLKMLETKIKEDKSKIQLNKSIKILNKDFKRRLEFSFSNLSDSFYKIINHTSEYKEMNFLESDIQKKEKEFIDKIKNIEKAFYLLVEKEWGFNNLDKDVQYLKDIQIDSNEYTQLFGVSKKVLIVLGALIGGTTGGSIGFSLDSASLFGSMGMGTAFFALGGTITGSLSVLGITNLVDKRTKGFGKQKITILGPLKLNYKLAILAKMYFFVELISKRSHANRNTFNFKENENLMEKLFNKENRNKIVKILNIKEKEIFIKDLNLLLIKNYLNDKKEKTQSLQLLLKA